jgi:hypothetical protein
MSEKTQHTAAGLREKMLQRYSDGLTHKHNKNHLPYRLHFKSHPSNQLHEEDEESQPNGSTGLIREFKLKKVRKRQDGRVH